MKPYPWTAFNVPVLVTWQRVRDLIITALEGGIGYWCRLEATEPANRSCSLFDVPTQPDAEGNIGGGALLLRELNDDGSEERLLRLDMTAMWCMARAATARARHQQTDVWGVGKGTTPPPCPDDRHDGRCCVTYIAACRVRHEADGGQPCRAEATHCLRHGWRWRNRDDAR